VGAVIAIAALVIAAGIGLGLRRANGRFRTTTAKAGAPEVDPVLLGLGITADTPLTLLQFSSAFCAPCRATRVLCADLAERTPGVRHLEVDAQSHVDAARALEIWRTPTVLLIDGSGQIRRRASGAPNRAQLHAAVESVLGKGTLAA
jgi:hypothetical protein